VKKAPRGEQPKPKAKRRQRFLPRALGTTGGVALAAVAFWFFKEQAENVMDRSAQRYVHTIDNPPLTKALHAITQLGSHAAIGTAAGITALAMLKQGRREDAWTVVISTGGAMAINTILKNIFQRQRPKELARRIKLPASHSFPSGHSLLSAATYPIVAHHFVQNRSVATQGLAHTLAGMTILTVGFSRIYFGVHFPSDVLGGFAAGFGWLGLTALSHTVVDRSSEP
jgi:hypothetical protein